MKAIIYTQFGSPEVLHIEEVEKPVPGEHEILVRVKAAPVGYGDLTARNFKNLPLSEFHMPLALLLPTKIYFGWNKPRVNILGGEFAGVVEAVGKSARRFKTGDQVYGYLGQRMGAYAEYLCVPEGGCVALKPSNLSDAEAAALPYGAIMASALLRHAQIQPGQKVLVNGASGGIGSAAVQLAKAYGAQVTGVCATPRLDYVKSLGADKVIDYTKEDFTQDGETYDLILDVLDKSSFTRCRKSLQPDGIYLMASFKMKAVVQMLWTKLFGRQRVICALTSERAEDLDAVRELVEAGKYRAIVDQCYAMEQAAEAHRYAESGWKKGSVVIALA